MPGLWWHDLACLSLTPGGTSWNMEEANSHHDMHHMHDVSYLCCSNKKVALPCRSGRPAASDPCLPASAGEWGSLTEALL